MSNATSTGSATELGRLVHPSALDRHHVCRWAGGGRVIEQDVEVVACDRPHLFPPSGPDWVRLDLGGVAVFLRRPAV